MRVSQANMLARKRDVHVEIVLLDHGLYRQITDDFRHVSDYDTEIGTELKAYTLECTTHSYDLTLRTLRLSRRIQYAKLWKSLIMADVEGIKSASAHMNAGESYALFAGMLTNRPWEKVCPPSIAAYVLCRRLYGQG